MPIRQANQRQPQLYAHCRRLVGHRDAHCSSSLAENKVLTDFQPHVTLEDLDVHAYEEVTWQATGEACL